MTHSLERREKRKSKVMLVHVSAKIVLLWYTRESLASDSDREIP